MSDQTSPTQQPLLAGDDQQHLRTRWIQIEEGFVDDPHAAVQQADDLIDDVIDRLRDALSSQRANLRSGWESLDDATTEQLRETLHRYEQMFTQLNELPAPSGWQDRERDGRATTHGRSTFPSNDTNTQSDSDMGAR